MINNILNFFNKKKQPQESLSKWDQAHQFRYFKATNIYKLEKLCRRMNEQNFFLYHRTKEWLTFNRSCDQEMANQLQNKILRNV